MADPVSTLQSAGFDDNEVAAWSQEKRSALVGAGFQDKEIDAYFAGGVVAPDEPPKALVDRALSEHITLGTVAGSAWNDLKKLADSIRSGLTLAGDVASGKAILPSSGAVPGTVEFGDQDSAGERVADMALLIGTGTMPMWRTVRGPLGSRVEQIGTMPKSEDFVNAARVVGDDRMPVQEKMLKLYEDNGIHPAEAAHAAETDPVVAQKLLSSDPKDMPSAPRTSEEPPPAPPKPPKEPTPPPEGSFEEAQQKVLEKVSVGDHDARALSWDKLYTDTIDDLHPLKAVSEDAYELARLTRGQFGKAEHFIEHGTFDFNTYKNNGKPLKDIIEPVSKDLDGFRAFLTSKRALEIEATERKSGIDTAAAQRVVEEGQGRFGKAATQLVDYQNNLLRYLKDSGVLSDRAFDAMVEANKNYVPFYRVLFADEAGPKGGKGFGPGNPVKALKGSERGIVDPLESVIKNTYAYISIAERNGVGIKLIDALKEQGFKASTKSPKLEGGEGELVEYLKQNGVHDAEALVDFVKETGTKDGEAISAWRDGKRESVDVKDPELVKAFRHIDEQSVGLLTKVFAAPAKMLRAGSVLTPDFIARNLIRDFQTAFVNSKGVFTPIDTAKGISSVIRRDADFQNWLKSGGANSTMVAMDRRYMQESLETLTKETGLGTRAWNVLTNPLAPLRMMSELMENATRLGEFKKVAAGDTSKAALQSAGYAAREVTLDFAKIGARMRAYNMVTAFANAQIQGVDRIVRAFIDRPVNTTAKIAGGITLPSVLLWYANHGDPRYEELPDWQKDLFWIVLTDKWEKIDPADAATKPAHLVRQQGDNWEVNNGHIWRIPKPFELGVIFGSGVERALDATVGQNKEAFAGFAKSVMQVLTPSYIPTAVQPVFEQWANRSTFTDRTLIPADVEKQLPEYQYTPYTTELSKALGQIVAAFPGMRDASVEPGAVMGPAARALTTPILIENYVRSWTGGLGTYALQGADAALRKAGILPDPITPTPTLADIPFIKAFAVRYPSASSESIQYFYDDYAANKRFYDTWMAKAKEGDTVALERIQAAGGPQMFVQLDAIKETLSEHSKLVRDIYKNPNMPADEKRQLIDGLYYNMIQIGKGGRDMLMQARGSLGAPGKETQYNMLGDFVNRVFGSTDPIVTAAEKIKNYPTSEDVEFAKKAGFYQDIYEPWTQGEVARVIKGSAVGRRLSELTSEEASTLVKGNPVLAEVYAKGALVANRVPIAALGFNPDRTALETTLTKPNVAGAYEPESDRMFVVAAAASTIVHESIHRGLEYMRQHSPEARQIMDTLRSAGSISEESIVRYLMAKEAGDPEKGTGDVADSQRGSAMILFDGGNAPRARAKSLDRLTAIAQELVAQRWPSRGARQ